MATLKQKRELAKQAGLAVEPTFKVVVSTPLGPFTKGDPLTEKRHIVDYFKLELSSGENAEDHGLSDDQIWVGINKINIEGLSDDDANMARIDYLQSLATKDDPIVDYTTLSASLPVVAEIMQLGAKADTILDAHINKAIEGKKDYDGAPIVIEQDLIRIYGEEAMTGWPAIGTRKQGRKNKKGQSTDSFDDTRPNDPTDYFKLETAEGDKYLRWLNIFVEAMPPVARMVIRRKTIKALINKEDLVKVGIPEDLAKLIPPHLDTWDTSGLDGKLRDVSSDITSYVNRIGRGIAFWQQKRRIQDKMHTKVRVGLSDATPEATSRRNKPVVLRGATVDPVTKEVEWNKMPPISLTKFLRYDVAKAVASGGTLAALEKTVAKGTGKQAATPNAQGSPVAMVTNVHQLGDMLANTYSYLSSGDKTALLMEKINGPEGGMFASRLVYVYSALSDIINTKGVTEKAVAYDELQSEAQSVADKAKKVA